MICSGLLHIMSDWLLYSLGGLSLAMAVVVIIMLLRM